MDPLDLADPEALTDLWAQLARVVPVVQQVQAAQVAPQARVVRKVPAELLAQVVL